MKTNTLFPNAMDRFPGQGNNTVNEKDAGGQNQTEFLNLITSSSLPPHSMTLKVTTSIILLGNIAANLPVD